MPDQITSFTLERSTDQIDWQPVSGSPLGGGVREYTDTTTGPSLYYRLTGHTAEGLDFDYNIVQVTSTGGWVKPIGGTGDDYGVTVAVDSSGNVVVCGLFSGSVTLGTVGGNPVTLNSAGSYDIFIAKYGSSGALIWAKRYGGVNNETGLRSMALDTNGNIYIGGSYSGTCNFGGSNFTSNTNNSDPFLAKYDSSGNHVWSIDFLKGIVGDRVTRVAADVSGNVYVCGQFQGGSFASPLMINNGIGLYSAFNQPDAFVIKFNSASVCQWATALQSQGGVEECTDISIAPDGNLLIAGFDDSGINLGGGWLIEGGFIGKLNSSNGSHLWSRSLATTAPGNASGGDGIRGRVFAAGLDPSGNVYVAGYFPNFRTYLGGYPNDPNSGVINGSSAQVTMFIAKYSETGVFVWGYPLPCTYSGNPLQVACDSQGNFTIAGYFVSTVDFRGTALTTAPAITSGFVAKYSTLGNLLWVKGLMGSQTTSINDVTTDSSNNVIVTGGYSGTPSFNGQTLTNTGGSDILLAKLNP